MTIGTNRSVTYRLENTYDNISYPEPNCEGDDDTILFLRPKNVQTPANRVIHFELATTMIEALVTFMHSTYFMYSNKPKILEAIPRCLLI